MKRTFHIWVKNNKTNEVKCKIVEANSFAGAASQAYFLSHSLRETTKNDWHIMSINNMEFSHDPEIPIV
jgi:hypothetical protein